MSLSEELKPCPWCNSIPQIFPKRPEIEGDAWSQVACVCDDCAVRPATDKHYSEDPNEHRADAITAWNTRKEGPQPAGWRLAPEEATREMLKAAADYADRCAIGNYGGCPDHEGLWDAMLAASPTSFPEDGQ